MNDADCPSPPVSRPPSPGDGGADEGMVDHHYQPLYRFAVGLSRDPSHAADLTQQTFYLWALRGHQLRDRQKVKSWLYTTLYREFLREVRRKSCFALVEFEDDLVGVPVAGPSGGTAVDGAVAMRALQRVGEPFRAPLLLFYLEDFSYGEIARALGIPLGTVMSRLSRGRSELRARFHRGGELPAPALHPSAAGTRGSGRRAASFPPREAAGGLTSVAPPAPMG